MNNYSAAAWLISYLQWFNFAQLFLESARKFETSCHVGFAGKSGTSVCRVTGRWRRGTTLANNWHVFLMAQMFGSVKKTPWWVWTSLSSCGATECNYCWQHESSCSYTLTGAAGGELVHVMLPWSHWACRAGWGLLSPAAVQDGRVRVRCATEWQPHWKSSWF